jgi:hypothetical protein
MGSLLSNCRRLRADIYGEILIPSKKKLLLSLFKIIYRPRPKQDANFVLRIDRLVPETPLKRFAPFTKAKVESRKFRLFYNLSQKKLKYIVNRAQFRSINLQKQIFSFLESQIWVILWRSQFFPRLHIKNIIKSKYVKKEDVFITTPSFHVIPGDIIRIKRFPYFLYERYQRKQLAVFETSLYIDYKNLFIIKLDQNEIPFFFFE